MKKSPITLRNSTSLTATLVALLCLAGCSSNESEQHHLTLEGFGTGQDMQVSFARSTTKSAKIEKVEKKVVVAKTPAKTKPVSTQPVQPKQTAPKKAAPKKATPKTVVALATPKPAPAAAGSDSKHPKLSKGTGGFAGTILFDGTPPPQGIKFKKGAAPADPSVCGAQAIPDESLIIDPKSKGVKNVFVYLKKKPKGWKGTTPKQPVVFDQKGCIFFPHNLVVRAGQTVLVKNGDPVGHNTHTNPLRNSAFNQVIAPSNRKGVPLTFRKAESLPVKVVCDIHSWMNAYQLVVDHPFAAVTDKNGEFAIPDLKPGKYTFTIWHERPGYLERKFKITVKAGTYLEKTLKFKAAKFPAS